jgi:anthranilate synthase component 2
VIEAWGSHKPVLGICLGHQAIAEAFGAKLVNLGMVRHGKKIPIFTSTDEPLFCGLHNPFEAGLYHSWAVSEDSIPDCIKVTARSEEGMVMAIKHTEYCIHGLQFHPESFMTPGGLRIVKNWLNLK